MSGSVLDISDAQHEAYEVLLRKAGSERRLGLLYARGRLTPEEEQAVEAVTGFPLRLCWAALALVDDRQAPFTNWKL